MPLIESWPTSFSHWTRAKTSLAGGVATGLRGSMQPHPVYFAGGKGAVLTDVDGHSYLDYVLGWGPVILGHGNPHVTEAVARQLPLGATYGSGHAMEYIAAEQVLAALPGMERLLWSNTGSEATQVALRLARAHTGRQRFLKIEGGYHGWSDTFLLGYRPGADGSMQALGTKGQNPHALDDVSFAPWGDLDAVKRVLADADTDIAAVFVEPVMCNSGVIEPPDGYLLGLRRLCDERGVVLVFDEVITGFRIAMGGAVERYGVTPDLVVLAKALAGGYPVSAIVGRAEVIDETGRGVVHAGTYNGNPVVLAAVHATLEVLDEEHTYPRLESMGSQLATGMRNALDAQEIAGTVHHVGSVVQVMIGVGSAANTAEFLQHDAGFHARLELELLRRGVFCLPGGRWYLSTAHTDSDVARTVEAFEAAVEAVSRERAGLERVGS